MLACTDPCSGLFDQVANLGGGNQICTELNGVWHESIDMSWFDPNLVRPLHRCARPTAMRCVIFLHDGAQVCFIYANTGGFGAGGGSGNCHTYCQSKGRVCLQAMDKPDAASSNCEVGGDHTAQSMANNGCLQNFQDQVC